MRPSGLPPIEPYRNGWSAHPPPVFAAAPRPSYRIHIVLFLLTLLTTTAQGMINEGVNPLEHLDLFYVGLPYSLTLLGILFCHEMGHYLTARHYGMEATLPYFLPAPPLIFIVGTFGAVIRLKSPPLNRNALLYMGAAGPIAGFCIAFPAMIYAYTQATVVPIPLNGMGISFAEPLLLQLIGGVVLGPIPEGYTIMINSVGMAAWFGVFVTVLNLLPMGQLDGGHIVYALAGQYARYVSWGVVCMLLALGFLFPGWFLWAIIGWVTSRRQQVVIDPVTPLDRRAYVIAGISLAIFILCFMPVPITIPDFVG